MPQIASWNMKTQKIRALDFGHYKFESVVIGLQRSGY
jgi:hypothetical protein